MQGLGPRAAHLQLEVRQGELGREDRVGILHFVADLAHRLVQTQTGLDAHDHHVQHVGECQKDGLLPALAEEPQDDVRQPEAQGCLCSATQIVRVPANSLGPQQCAAAEKQSGHQVGRTSGRRISAPVLRSRKPALASVFFSLFGIGLVHGGRTTCSRLEVFSKHHRHRVGLFEDCLGLGRARSAGSFISSNRSVPRGLGAAITPGANQASRGEKGRKSPVG